ncbi:MAG: hypothetical protein PVG44_13760, partial [Desulfobacterales bacterium]
RLVDWRASKKGMSEKELIIFSDGFDLAYHLNDHTVYGLKPNLSTILFNSAPYNSTNYFQPH